MAEAIDRVARHLSDSAGVYARIVGGAGDADAVDTAVAARAVAVALRDPARVARLVDGLIAANPAA